ncbi:MAG: putative ABC transporter permease [Spirochaetaceae bacterium]|nr:putative ABC transporter permease [Spirochaetaceae bacterium]
MAAFSGWIIESIYRSYKEQRFVNAAFLSGPFVPIYGFGVMVISVLHVEVLALSPIIDWTVTVLLPAVLEHMTSLLRDYVFGLKLWDYQSEAFNLKGRIALHFSLYWVLFALLLVLIIQPAIFARTINAGPCMRHFLAGIFAAYFAIDINHSIRSVSNFKHFQAEYCTVSRKRQAIQVGI